MNDAMDHKMRLTLWGNATFSVVSAASLIAFSEPLARMAGLPIWLVVTVGIGLVPFAGLVAHAARRRPLDRSQVQAITVADFVWVVAALLVIAVPGTMSTSGKWLLAGISLAVLVFGILEARGLRRRTGGHDVLATADTARSA